MRRSFRYVLAVAVALAACDPVDQGGPAVLDGYVYNTATNSGLNGAIVTVGRRTATTAAGNFRIADLPEGPIEITASHENYKTASITLNLVAGRNVGRIDLALSNVQGAVTSVSLTGDPVKMTVPGVMRFAAAFTVDGLPLRDTITPTLETTGPFTASWTKSVYPPYVTVTPTGAGTGTITVRVRSLTSSIAVEAVSVAAKQVDFSRGYGCLLAVDDTAWCWGGNRSGQLGAKTMPQCNGGACQYGGTNGNETPISVSGSKSLTQVVTQGFSCSNTIGSPQDCGRSCGLTANGDVWCWDGVPTLIPGMNLKSIALGSLPGTTLAANTFVRVCGLGFDGKAYCRNLNTGVEVGAGMTFKSYAVGANHDCGVDLAGDVYCWGDNRNGALGLGTLDTLAHSSPARIAISAKFSAVDLGTYSSCGLDSTGKIQCWGLDWRVGVAATCSARPCQPTPTPLSDSRAYIAFSHDLARTCGVATDGSADCWLGFDGARTPAPSTVPPLTSVSVGSGGGILGAIFPYYACGVGVDQTVYCWNDTTSYRIGR